MFVNPLAITVGEVLEKTKGSNMALITTYEQAIGKALEWSKSAPYSMNKGIARTYIEALPMAELEGKLQYNDPAKGRTMQIAYILGNLRGWRGQEARASKAILKQEYAKNK